MQLNFKLNFNTCLLLTLSFLLSSLANDCLLAVGVYQWQVFLLLPAHLFQFSRSSISIFHHLICSDQQACTSEARLHSAFAHTARLSAGKPSPHGGLPAALRARGVASEPPESHRYPPPPPPVSSCGGNELGAEGATALASGLTAVTKLQLIDVR